MTYIKLVYWPPPFSCSLTQKINDNILSSMQNDHMITSEGWGTYVMLILKEEYQFGINGFPFKKGPFLVILSQRISVLLFILYLNTFLL